MIYPNFAEEKKWWRKGFKYIAGLDEAGRGPLAGPVVAASVVVLDYKKLKINPVKYREAVISAKPKLFDWVKGINDSKKLSALQRENFYKILINHPQIKWGVGIVSEKIIDKINIEEKNFNEVLS